MEIKTQKRFSWQMCQVSSFRARQDV